MATVAELQARLAALDAIPAGVKQVQMGGQMVTYRTLDDLYRDRERIRAQIQALSGGSKGSVIWSRGGLD